MHAVTLVEGALVVHGEFSVGLEKVREEGRGKGPKKGGDDGDLSCLEE